MNDNQYKKATFSLSGEGDFEGIYHPSVSWNGWKCPLFLIEEVGRIALLVCEQNKGLSESRLIVEGGRVSYYSEEYEETRELPSLVINNGVYYAVNNFDWCWELKSE